MLINCTHPLFPSISPEIVYKFEIVRWTVIVFGILGGLLHNILLFISLFLQHFIVFPHNLRLEPPTGVLGVCDLNGEFYVCFDENLNCLFLRRFLASELGASTLIFQSFLWALAFCLRLLLILVLIALTVDLQHRWLERNLLLKLSLITQLLVIVFLHLFALLIRREEILDRNVIFGWNFQRPGIRFLKCSIVEFVRRLWQHLGPLAHCASRVLGILLAMLLVALNQILEMHWVWKVRIGWWVLKIGLWLEFLIHWEVLLVRWGYDLPSLERQRVISRSCFRTCQRDLAPALRFQLTTDDSMGAMNWINPIVLDGNLAHRSKSMHRPIILSIRRNFLSVMPDVGVYLLALAQPTKVSSITRVVISIVTLISIIAYESLEVVSHAFDFIIFIYVIIIPFAIVALCVLYWLKNSIPHYYIIIKNIFRIKFIK